MTITAQLADGRTLEFPDGTDPQVIQGTVKKVLGQRQQMPEPAFEREARETLSATPAELVSANPIVRAATTAARPVLAANNMLVRPFGLQGVDLEGLDAMQARGAKALGYGGVETVGQDIGGALLSPVSLGATKIAPAATAIGRVVQGAGIGGLAGVTAGTDAPLESAATGAAVGAAIPGTIEGVKAGARGLSHVADLFRGETGAGNILDRYIKNAVGDKNVPAVVAQLRSTQGQPLPGYKPTVAEAVAGLPEGSPLIAHQRITASTKGGPSADFGNRIIDQKAAIVAAAEARDAQIVPLLKNEIRRANANGIQASQIVSGIDKQLSTPGLRASDVVQKALTAVKEKISSLSNNGVLDGEDLWTVRKEIGNTIKTASKETANWDKRLTSGLERQIQKSIDQAIVDAGATRWPMYMNEYAARSQAIQRVKDSAKAAIRPDQRTDLFGGLRVAEETRTHVPQLLSRPMMAANAIMRYFSANIEPKIDKLAAQRYLNPKEFADALEKLPPQTQSQIMETMKRIGIASTVQQAMKDN